MSGSRQEKAASAPAGHLHEVTVQQRLEDPILESSETGRLSTQGEVFLLFVLPYDLFLPKSRRSEMTDQT